MNEIGLFSFYADFRVGTDWLTVVVCSLPSTGERLSSAEALLVVM